MKATMRKRRKSFSETDDVKSDIAFLLGPPTIEITNCESLTRPHLSHLQIDDQIALLINAWCELLVFSCCYRSINSPGLVRVSNEKSLSLASARHFGIDKCVDKMLNFTEQLRRLKVDHYEYVSMKVIVLLTSGSNIQTNLVFPSTPSSCYNR